MRWAWLVACAVVGCADEPEEQTPVGPLMIDLGERDCVATETHSLHDFIVQQDGTPLRCRHLSGPGGGFLPIGVTFDGDECLTMGAIDEPRAGTWAFVVEVVQSDVTAHVPLCISQTASESPYAIEVSPGALGTGTFAGNQPLSFGGGDEPRFSVTAPDDCPADSCVYGVAVNGSYAPFQTMEPAPLSELDPGAADQLRLEHGLTGGAQTVDPELAGRPQVVSLDIDYCFARYGGECDDIAQIVANAEPGSHYSIILRDE